MDNCIFCKIVKKEAPASIVYEDDNVMAFLTVTPINPGHVLVIPKNHEPNFYKLDDSTYQSVMAVVKKMAIAIDAAYKPEKVGELIAGWDVPHAHVHVLPMYDHQDITSKKMLDNALTQISAKELADTATKLVKSLEN